jgi:hypothetical protein
MDAAVKVRYHPGEMADAPRLWRGDVAVVGGGSAGSAAAVAAARSGARTLLIESGAFLGGTGARVLDTFYGFYAPGAEDRRVVGGVGWEVCERLSAAGMAFERPNTYGAGTGVTYEPEALKVVWDEMVGTSGARMLLHALVTAVVAEGPWIEGVVVATKAGPAVVEATVFVDATGDAEVAWRAGAALEHPAVDRRVQPLTATFRLGGVDRDPAPTSELHRLLAEAAGTADYDLPRREGSIHRTVLPGVRHANMTRVSGVDATDPWELTAAEIEGRRQVGEYVRFLIDRVPGYAHAYLIGTSTRIGVRESRRLVGEHLLTSDDVLTARDFPDAIARCGAPIEDHDAGGETRWIYVGSGDTTPTDRTYGIPYRCLLSRQVDNLLVAGRCLSATHDAHASVRSMAQCMAMGHAAGVAAAMAADGRTAVRDVEMERLRGDLRHQGAIL